MSATIAEKTPCAPMPDYLIGEIPPLGGQGAAPQAAGGVPETQCPQIKICGWGGAREGAGRPCNPDPKPRVQAKPAPKPDLLRKIQSRPLGPRWHVLELAHHAAHRVTREVAEGETRSGWPYRPGYRAELPMIAARRVRNGHAVMERVPMFPGYGFVEFDADADAWQALQQIDGVKRLFMTRTMRPIPLPVGFVEWLVSTASKRLSLTMPRKPPRQPGAPLTIADGPFATLPAVVVSCDGLATTACVEIFGRAVPVTMPYEAFDAAPSN